jgi:hypothetical protein
MIEEINDLHLYGSTMRVVNGYIQYIIICFRKEDSNVLNHIIDFFGRVNILRTSKSLTGEFVTYDLLTFSFSFQWQRRNPLSCF